MMGGRSVYRSAKVLGTIILSALIALGIWAVFMRADSPEPLKIIDVSAFKSRLELQWIKAWEPDFSMGYCMRLYSSERIIDSDITVNKNEPVRLFVSLFNDNPYHASSRLLIFLNGRPIPYSIDGADAQDFYTHELPPGGIINIPIEADCSEIEYNENIITFLYLHRLDDKPSEDMHIPDFTSAITRRLLIINNAEGSCLNEMSLTATETADPSLVNQGQAITLLHLIDEIPNKQRTQLKAPSIPCTLYISAYDPNPRLYATWFFVNDEPVMLEEQPCLVWKSGLDVMLRRSVVLPAPPMKSASLYAVSIPLQSADERWRIMSSEKVELQFQD
jgi:hypothetical protein